MGAFWPEWIYSFIDIYYQGKTLLIPDNIVNSLDLTQEELQTQGRLSDVSFIEFDGLLSEADAELLLLLESADITLDDGVEYHLITEIRDPASPLLLLRYQRQLYFIPQDLLLEIRGIL